MKAVYLTAGGAGMYCGSCMNDNALVREMRAQGHDVMLASLYTPVTTDDEDVSEDTVFIGGINAWLQQKSGLFRVLPPFLDRWLNRRSILNRISSKSVSVAASELGEMTLSMLKGQHGEQRKEQAELVKWLAAEKPDVVNLTNLLVGGIVPELKERVGCKVVVTLQGDDLFLDGLIDPWKGQVLEEMRRIAEQVDAFVLHSQFYADKMGALFGIPAERMTVIPLGIPNDVPPGERPASSRCIAYFARICPEKGFGELVEAFRELAAEDPAVRLVAGGWLGAGDEEFYREQLARLEDGGTERFHYAGVVDRDQKFEILRSADLLCVPTLYEEPKGLFALESLAAGTPVLLPAHGAFPELAERVGEGIRLFEPGNRAALVQALREGLDAGAGTFEPRIPYVADTAARTAELYAELCP